jgi:hypothetical protein
MHVATRILCAALGIAAAGGAVAQGGPDELWNMSTRMEMAGMPGQSFTSQVCMKKGQTQPDKMSQDKNCKVAELRTVGNKTTWKIECAGRDPMTCEGEMARTRDSMDGRMRMQGKRGNESFDMTTVISGKLAGGCTWEDPAKKAQAMVAQGEAQMAQMCRESMDKYLTMMFEGETAMCKAHKPEYCSRVSKMSQSMRIPAGYRKAMSQEGLRGQGWEQAALACRLKTAPVLADACKGAVSGRDWSFVGEYCPVEAKKIAAEHCAGRNYTALMGTEYGELCGRYASRAGEQQPAAAAAKQGQQQQQPQQPQSEPAAPSAADVVKEGAGALRRLFGR